MANRPSVFNNEFFDAGVPAAGYRLYTYESGTTTPKATYTDQAGTIPNTNPITLDADGMCELWLGAGEYTVSLYTDLIGSGGALVKTWDDVSGATAELTQNLANATYANQGARLVGTRQAGADMVARTLADRVTDIITAQDAGASVNGTTDGTTAINAVRVQSLASRTPALIPRTVKQTASAVGAEIIETRFSEAWETDMLGAVQAAMYNGTAVGIGVYGNSINWGVDVSTGLQFAETPVQRLQTTLRTFYKNTNITCTNRAIAGTTAVQMLAGTDGSGLTFEARVAADATESVIYCNHGINEVNSGRSAALFKRDLHQIVDVCRKYGKTLILQTPTPMLGNGAAQYDVNFELVRDYAEVVRQVCIETGTLLQDDYSTWLAYFCNGTVRTIDAYPDGIHFYQAGYIQHGLNMAGSLIKALVVGSQPRIFPAALPVALTSGAAPNGFPLPWSRTGYGRYTPDPALANQTIRIPIFVSDPGMDVSLTIFMHSLGAANSFVYVDEVFRGSLSFEYAQALAGPFFQEVEVPILRNIEPGFHLIEIRNNSGGLGVTTVRTRKSIRPRSFRGAQVVSAPPGSLRRNVPAIGPVFYQSTALDQNCVLFDEMPFGGFGDGAFAEVAGIEAEGQLLKDQYLVLRGGTTTGKNTTTNEGSAQPILTVGLNSSGFLTVIEQDGGAPVVSVLDAVDHSLASAVYLITVAGIGMNIFINGTLAGTYNVTKTYRRGGLVGLYTVNTASPITLKRIDYVF